MCFSIVVNQETSTSNQKSSENGLGQHQGASVILKKSKWLEKVNNLFQTVQKYIKFPGYCMTWAFLTFILPTIGAYGAAVLYRKKDDDSLVILKEINMHDLTAQERQLATNEVWYNHIMHGSCLGLLQQRFLWKSRILIVQMQINQVRLRYLAGPVKILL